MIHKRIYLDNNATTKIDPQILKIIYEELSGDPSNPSSIHSFGQKAKANLLEATSKVARFFDVKEQEVLFTSGATEALNMLLKGFLNLQKKHIITSTVEHAAVYQTLKMAEKKGYSITFLSPVVGTSTISKEQVENAIRPDTGLICLMAANNETGELTDIHAIASLAESKNIFFISDGVALLGKKVFTLPTGLSAICFSGHKVHASKGVGLAIVRKNFKWDPLIIGGPQQYGKRGGTENLAAILGFAEVFSSLMIEQEKSIQNMQMLRDYFEVCLKQNLSNITINGNHPRVSNTSNVTFHGIDGEALLFKLDLEGVKASMGSACMSGGREPSRVLLNMGLTRQQANSSLRFSLSKYTTKEEIDETLQILFKNLKT